MDACRLPVASIPALNTTGSMQIPIWMKAKYRIPPQFAILKSLYSLLSAKPYFFSITFISSVAATANRAAQIKPRTEEDAYRQSGTTLAVMPI